jgi:hypothetical protein
MAAEKVSALRVHQMPGGHWVWAFFVSSPGKQERLFLSRGPFRNEAEAAAAGTQARALALSERLTAEPRMSTDRPIPQDLESAGPQRSGAGRP